MRLTARVRSLQRTLVAPVRIEDWPPGHLALLDELLGDDPDDPAGGGPQPPGARFLRFRDACLKNARDQKTPKPVIFSLLPRLAAAAVKSLTSAIAPAARSVY